MMRPALLRVGVKWLQRQLTDWNSPGATMMVRSGGLAVNFGALALVARWAGQESLGLIIAMNGASFLGGAIFALGVPTLILKTITAHLLQGGDELAAAQYRRGQRLVLNASFVGCSLLALLAAAQGIGWLPAKVGSLGALELLTLGGGSAAMAVQFVGLSAIRAMKQPALSGFFQFCTAPILLLAAFLAVRAFAPVITQRWALLALSASLVINSLLVHGFARCKLPMKRRVVLEPMPWAETRAMWLLGVLSVASGNIPLLAGAVLLDPARVALLGVPFRICNLPMTVVAALGAYYAPLIREAHLHGDIKWQRRELHESQWIGAALVLPLLILAGVFPDYILGFFCVTGHDARVLLLLFSLAQLLIAGCGVAEQYLAMTDKALAASRITFCCLLGMLGAIFFPIESHSAYWIGCCWAIFAVLRQASLRLLCRSVD